MSPAVLLRNACEVCCSEKPPGPHRLPPLPLTFFLLLFAAFKYTRMTNHSLLRVIRRDVLLILITINFFWESWEIHMEIRSKHRTVSDLHEKSAACFLSHGSIYRCEQIHFSGVGIKRPWKEDKMAKAENTSWSVESTLCISFGCGCEHKWRQIVFNKHFLCRGITVHLVWYFHSISYFHLQDGIPNILSPVWRCLTKLLLKESGISM